MESNWLWQGLVSNLVWELLIVAAGIVMAILRKRDSKWVAPVLYGLVTVACLAVIWFTFTGRSLFSTPQPKITPENIEANLRTWTDNVAISLERTTIPDSYFSYTARLHGGDPIEVFRAKEKPSYLQFQARVNFSPEHQIAMSKLSKAQAEKVIQELALEVSRVKISSTIATLTGPKGEPIQTAVVLQKGVLIPDLNEGFFVDSFDEMTRTVALVRAATNLALAQTKASASKQPISQ